MSSAKVRHKLTGVKDAGSSVLVKEEHQAGAVLHQELPPIPTANLAPSSDVTKRFEELTSFKPIAPKGHDTASALTIDLTAINPGALLGPGEAGLRTARKLIDEKRFPEARQVLQTLLQEVPNLSEASYLAGLCDFRLGEFKSALKRIRDIKDNAMQARKRALQDEIQASVEPLLKEQFLGLLLQNKLDEAIAEAKEFADLDPGAGFYNLYYVGGLLSANRLPQAKAASASAVAQCKDRYLENLKSLQREIADRDLEEHLDEARRAYRAVKYSKARKLLDKVPQEYRDTPLWRTFRDYLEALGGGIFSRGLDPSAVQPAGLREQVNRMCAYLVTEETGLIDGLLALGAFEQALQVAQAALRLAPHYSYTNYLFALSIYSMIQASWRGHRAPLDPDTSLQWLAKARQHAGIAASDPAIRQGGEFAAAIDTAAGMIRSVKAEMDRQIEEARRVAAVRQKFNSIFELAGDGIASLDHLNQIRQRLEAVREEARSVLASVHGEAARSHAGRIKDAIEQNLTQLKDLEPVIRESEQVADISDQLLRILEPVKGGVRDSKQHAQIRNAIIQLQSKAAVVRRGLGRDESRVELDGLIELINSRRQELDGMEHRFSDDAILNPLLEEFKQLMDGVTQKKLSIDQFQKKIGNLSSKTRGVGRQLKTEAARTTFGQLEKAIVARLQEAEQAGASEADAKLVKPIMEFFTSTMESVKSRTIDADAFRWALEYIKEQTCDVKQKVRSTEAREALDKLEKAADGYLDQISGIR